MKLTDTELTAEAQKDPKCILFKKWLLENGAIFEDTVEFPCVFKGGLMGLAAKTEIKHKFAFMFIPSKCIITLERAKSSLKDIIEQNDSLFGKDHPDAEQLTMATYLLQ